MWLLGILCQTKLCRLGRFTLTCCPTIASVRSNSTSRGISICVCVVLGCQPHPNLSASHRFFVGSDDGLERLLRRSILEKRIATRLTSLWPTLVEEQVEFRDLAESAERLKEGVFVDAWIKIADVQPGFVLGGSGSGSGGSCGLGRV